MKTGYLKKMVRAEGGGITFLKKKKNQQRGVNFLLFKKCWGTSRLKEGGGLKWQKKCQLRFE